MSNNNGKGFSPTTIIERTWEGLPGAILRFPVSIALSGKMATYREQSVALGTNEKAERLLDFRFKTLSDVLDEAPSMIRTERLEAALKAKIDQETEAALKDMPEATEEDLEKRAETRTRIRQETKLTRDEVESLAEPFPDYPDATPEKGLAETAYSYFTQEDEKGRKVFQFLIEDVINEFWYWATPRPTISVYAFMQDK